MEQIETQGSLQHADDDPVSLINSRISIRVAHIQYTRHRYDDWATAELCTGGVGDEHIIMCGVLLLVLIVGTN